MGTILELLRIVDKLSQKKRKNEISKDDKKFKEILREEMKNINRN